MVHHYVMEAVICDITALNYWRTRSDSLGSSSSRGRAVPERRSHLEVDAPSAATVDYIKSLGLANDGDVHLLVGSSEQRRLLNGARVELIGSELPSRSFVRALAQIYTVSPELLFLMSARRLSFVELLELGHELCGTYRLTSPHVTYGVEPLSSVAALRNYAQKAKGIHGRGVALRACKYLADGSASPAETALSIAFRLPHRYGGYGLGNPLLNQEIPLNASASKLLGWQTTIKPDFYWKASHFPSEYDSGLYHSDREQADTDERRRNAYAALGMNVVVVRPRHLCSIDLLDEIANTIRKNIGLRLNHLPAGYAELHSNLFEEVFRYWIKIHDDFPGRQDYVFEASRLSEPVDPY